MEPLKSSLINLKAGVVSMQGGISHTTQLDIIKILLLSSKVHKRLSIFLFLQSFLTCSFSLSPRLLSSRLSHFPFFLFLSSFFYVLFFHPDYHAWLFFLFPHIFVTIFFYYHQGYHTFLFFFWCPPFLNVPFFIIKNSTT